MAVISFDWLCKIIVLFACCCYPATGVMHVSLDGQWTAINSNGSIKIPATVPGGIYTDLKKYGLIGEPFYGFNDVQYDWVGKENWTFYRYFDVPGDLFAKDRVSLVAYGIDTVCSVWLNDVLMFNTVNMYVRYSADVHTGSLREHSNSIQVSCESPVLYALRKHKEHLRSSYPVYPLCPPAVQNGQCHVNFIRKMPCSFSWDWGPSFPSTGIWKSIGLEGYSGIIIRDVLVTTMPQKPGSGSKWRIRVIVHYESALHEPENGTVWLSLDEQMLLSKQVTVQPAGAAPANVDLSVAIPNEMDVELWWPSGYGGQRLYNLNVTIRIGDETAVKVSRFGFRTIELNQDSVEGSTMGTEFYFKINRVPIYAKGSNWIPADSFPERVTNEYVKDLLLSVKEANMNMLRVWGGGVYESDYFYDLADELGILIWQDMMFAVSLYPVDSPFLENVALEVQQQVRRLQRHPSIVAWAANNENEEAIAYVWWPQMLLRMLQYRRDYRRLYIQTIMPVIGKYDVSRPFLSSSPSNGRVTSMTSWISVNPNSNNNGDTHYYNYMSNAWDPATYPLARFVSEHGLQSYPSRDAFVAVAPSSMITYPFSLFLDHRQHLRLGQLYLIRAIRQHFKFNTASKRGSFKERSKAYDMISYLSQTHQAMGIRTAAETFRRWRSYLKGGLGHNMGFLYWQLNDIWQAPSWASIEYGGRWKMLHYFAKKFFSPAIVSPYVDTDHSLRVFIVNDHSAPVETAVLSVTQYKWTSFAPIETTTINVTMPQAASFDAYRMSMDEVWKRGVCEGATCFLWFTLSDPISKLPLTPDNFLLPMDPKYISLPEASINVSSVLGPRSSPSRPDVKIFEIGLRTDNIALFVWLNAHNVTGHFSDNGFLMKDRAQIVQFYTRENVTAHSLGEALTVSSLKDYEGVRADPNSLIRNDRRQFL